MLSPLHLLLEEGLAQVVNALHHGRHVQHVEGLGVNVADLN